MLEEDVRTDGPRRHEWDSTWESGRGQQQVLTCAAWSPLPRGSGQTLHSPAVWSQGSAQVRAENRAGSERWRVLPEEPVSGCNWYSSVIVVSPRALVCPAR